MTQPLSIRSKKKNLFFDENLTTEDHFASETLFLSNKQKHIVSLRVPSIRNWHDAQNGIDRMAVASYNIQNLYDTLASYGQVKVHFTARQMYIMVQRKNPPGQQPMLIQSRSYVWQCAIAQLLYAQCS